jgi:hypothetical protein
MGHAAGTISWEMCHGQFGEAVAEMRTSKALCLVYVLESDSQDGIPALWC